MGTSHVHPDRYTTLHYHNEGATYLLPTNSCKYSRAQQRDFACPACDIKRNLTLKSTAEGCPSSGLPKWKLKNIAENAHHAFVHQPDKQQGHGSKTHVCPAYHLTKMIGAWWAGGTLRLQPAKMINTCVRKIPSYSQSRIPS